MGISLLATSWERNLLQAFFPIFVFSIQRDGCSPSPAISESCNIVWPFLMFCVWVSLGCTPTSWAAKLAGQQTELLMIAGSMAQLLSVMVVPISNPPVAGITPLLLIFCHPLDQRDISFTVLNCYFPTTGDSYILLGFSWLDFFFF